MKDNTIKKLVFAALFAALSCAATMVIRIPTPIGGYIHAGDAVVLLSAFLLGPWWGAAAAFLIVFGTSFHCMHRIFFSLHDLKFHPGKAGKAICYGIATILSVAAACGLAMGL